VVSAAGVTAEEVAAAMAAEGLAGATAAEDLAAATVAEEAVEALEAEMAAVEEEEEESGQEAEEEPSKQLNLMFALQEFMLSEERETLLPLSTLFPVLVFTMRRESKLKGLRRGIRKNTEFGTRSVQSWPLLSHQEWTNARLLRVRRYCTWAPQVEQLCPTSATL